VRVDSQGEIRWKKKKSAGKAGNVKVEVHPKGLVDPPKNARGVGVGDGETRTTVI